MSRCQSSLFDGFTDDWDAALLSEGTLRPKRAASAMNLREAMKTIAKSPNGAVTREDLENHFSRSMKLLGLDGVESVSSKASHKLKLNNVAPRTVTRLERPTVSYEDIRNAVTDGVDRKVLSQAAYERWYFRKVDEAREQRMKGLFELDKRSKLFEHGLSFGEWLEKKNKERRTKKPTPEKTVEKSARKRLAMSSPTTKEAAEKAYKDWVNKKTSEDARKKQKLKEEREARASDKSRENAEKVFEEWKRLHDEKLKTTEERKRKREQKAKEKEKEEKDKTAQDAEKAFNAWLSNKNQLLQKEEEHIKKQTKEKTLEEQKRIAEKRHEAKRAFEDWLEKKLELEASKAPPPPPKATKSVQTEDEVKSAPVTPVPKCKNLPKHLLGPWHYPPPANKQPNKSHKTKVKFAEAWDPTPVNSYKTFDYKNFSKQQLSDNRTLMMLYHKQDPNCALYYARDIN